MDFNVTTNRVVLNAAEARKLCEASALLKHITRLAGAEPAGTAGDWARDASGAIDTTLTMVDWTRPNPPNCAAAGETKIESPPAAK